MALFLEWFKTPFGMVSLIVSLVLAFVGAWWMN